MINNLITLSKKLKSIGLNIEAEEVEALIKESTVSSVSSIVSLGYPQIVAKILREMFGTNAFLIAKWLKEYRGNGPDFLDKIGHRTAFKSDLRLYVEMIAAAEKGIEAYQQFQRDNEFEIEDFPDLMEKKVGAIEAIKAEIQNDIFFYNDFAKAILNNQITNLNEYKKLSFSEASEKYNQKRVFQGSPIVKDYPNGYRWINVGDKCDLIGNRMRNCGSAGAMSTDPDKTILTLFDEKNDPHVLLTYSPNEKRISGYEGKAGTAPKDEYLDYILDLEKVLNARIDTHSEGAHSKFLKLRVLLEKFAKQITRIPTENTFDEYFEIIGNDDKIYYSNFYDIIPKEIIDSEIAFIKNEDPEPRSFEDYLRKIFGHRYDFALENRDKALNPYIIYNQTKKA